MRSANRQAVMLTALAVGVFQVIGSYGAAANQPERRGIDAFALVLVLAGPIGLAVRDRWPLGAVMVAAGAACVYIGAGYAYGPIFVSVVVALVAAVVVGRRAGAWALAVAGYAGFVLAMAVDPRREGGVGLVKPALVAGWLVVVLAVAELVRARQATLAARVRAEVIERERRESEQRLALAQDLHDVLAHHISLINVQAGVALHLIDSQPERARPALAEIKGASRTALRELRVALDILRSGDAAPRSPLPRLVDLDRLVDTVRASGLEVELVERGARPDMLAANVEATVYRIVQEALTNVTRHAHARRAAVHLTYGEGLTIEITDDGAGLGEPTAGAGITGMRERAATLGGTFDAGPAPDGGFRVIAQLPIGAP